MADSPSIGVCGVGLGVVRFSIWQTLLRKGMWILFGFDSDHRTGNLHLHAVFDSRRGRGHVAHAGLVFFPYSLRTRKSFALDLLGIRRHRRAGRAHQEPDRHRFPWNDHFCLRADDRWLQKASQDASGFKHPCFPGHRCAVAHPFGDSQPGATLGPGTRISLVLFHQRTIPALHK